MDRPFEPRQTVVDLRRVDHERRYEAERVVAGRVDEKPFTLARCIGNRLRAVRFADGEAEHEPEPTRQIENALITYSDFQQPLCELGPARTRLYPGRPGPDPSASWAPRARTLASRSSVSRRRK